MNQYRALRDELHASRGVKLYNDMLSRQITFYTFEQNHAELDAFIRLHHQLKVKRQLGDFENRKPLHDFLYELTRRLQNFVFAAKALVDHTRNYVQESHGGHPNIYPTYQAQVVKHFGKSGIGAFTKCLRDYFAHCATPFISSLDDTEARTRPRFSLQLDTGDMSRSAEFRGWSPSAQRYIAEHRDSAEHDGTQVDLGLYVNDYYEAVIRFYSWLDERNQEWCRSDWEHSASLHREIESYWGKRPPVKNGDGQKTTANPPTEMC
jgi:hypothetical protein